MGIFQSLESLTITDSPVVDLSEISSLKRLRRLNLIDNKKLCSLAHLASLTNLELLTVAGCQGVEKLDVRGTCWPNLRYLDLSRTSVWTPEDIAVIATFESLDTLLLAGTPLEADKHFPGNVQDMCPWLVRINDIVATAYSEATNPLERHFELFTYDVESNHPCFLSNRTITQLMGKYQDFKAQRDEMATRMEHRFQALECEVALEAPGENLAPVERYLAILEAKASKEAVVTARQYEFDSDVTPRAGLDALRTRFVLALTDALAFLAADDERFTIRLQRRLALCLRLAYAATCSGPPRAIIIGPASLVSRMENLRTALMEAHDLAAHNVLEDVLKTPSDVLRTSDSVGTPEEETKSLD